MLYFTVLGRHRRQTRALGPALILCNDDALCLRPPVCALNEMHRFVTCISLLGRNTIMTTTETHEQVEHRYMTQEQAQRISVGRFSTWRGGVCWGAGCTGQDRVLHETSPCFARRHAAEEHIAVLQSIRHVHVL